MSIVIRRNSKSSQGEEKMTTSIQSNPLYHLPHGHAYGKQNYHEATQLAFSESQKSSITITTDQGDVVTLTASHEQAAYLDFESRGNFAGQSMNFTAASLESDFFSLSVQGDLNDKELADIYTLMEDLTDIAGNFFSGNLDDAMTDALQIGDMGSLSSLSATFTHSLAMSATQLTEYHPLPSFEEAGDLFSELRDQLDKKLPEKLNYSDLMLARWQQMNDYQKESEPPELKGKEPWGKFHADDQRTAEKMMKRIEKFSGHHPQLTPYGPSLANKAIDKAAASLPSHSTILRDQLKYDFMNEMNNWMMS